ncbi:MAG: hypothetical protein CVV27_09010 [Candidatus Melainabacteria bacterium HGW-Melainabacteria-1]|nr:MAG: hypothetical protein CVV27_09010 [Candidatus Melainabacteria bacterium HGW-Melainabacteria-1]
MSASIWVRDVPGRAAAGAGSHRVEVDVLDARHYCLLSGSLVDTPAGRQPVDCLKPGAHIWGFERGERIPTLIEKVYRADQAPAGLKGLRLHETVTLGENAWLFRQGQWIRAGQTDLPQVELLGPIYDLSTDTGNFFCHGVLIGHQDPDLSQAD